MRILINIDMELLEWNTVVEQFYVALSLECGRDPPGIAGLIQNIVIASTDFQR